MCSTASPSLPTRFSAGTRTSSNTSSAVADARMPHLSLMRWPSEKPSMPFSTSSSECLPAPSPSLVRAYTRNVSPSVSSSMQPFVIHIFEPFST